MHEADTRTQVAQPAVNARRLNVGTTDGVPQVQQDLGNAAHSGTANTDKVNALYSMFHAALPATCSQASAICCAAFRLACSWACSAHCTSSSRLRSRSQPASHSAENPSCFCSHAPWQSLR